MEMRAKCHLQYGMTFFSSSSVLGPPATLSRYHQHHHDKIWECGTRDLLSQSKQSKGNCWKFLCMPFAVVPLNPLSSTLPIQQFTYVHIELTYLNPPARSALKSSLHAVPWMSWCFGIASWNVTFLFQELLLIPNLMYLVQVSACILTRSPNPYLTLP